MTLAVQRRRSPLHRCSVLGLHRQGREAELPVRHSLRPPHLVARRRQLSFGRPRNDKPSWGSVPLRRSSWEASNPPRFPSRGLTSDPTAPLPASISSLMLQHVQDSLEISRLPVLFAPRLPCLPGMFQPGGVLGVCPTESDHPRADTAFFDVAIVGSVCPSFPWPSHRCRFASDSVLLWVVRPTTIGWPEPWRHRTPTCNQAEQHDTSHEPLRMRPGLLPACLPHGRIAVRHLANFRLGLKRLPLQAWRASRPLLANGVPARFTFLADRACD